MKGTDTIAEKKIADKLVDNFEVRIKELEEIRNRARTVRQSLLASDEPQTVEGNSSEPDLSTLESKLRTQDKQMSDNISDIMSYLSDIERFV